MDRIEPKKFGSAARIQAAAAAVSLAAVASVCIGFGAAGRCSSLVDAMDRVIEHRYAQAKIVPWNHGAFIDLEDRLLLDELPSDDYSRGGVYLIGASKLKWATRLWELPQEERSLIHNYGIGASSHTGQFQFVRYLVEKRDLLRAGGEKNLIVFGVAYHCTPFSCGPASFWAELWRRRGLYEYSPEMGISEARRNPLSRFYRVERARVAGMAEKAKKCLMVCCERLVRDAPPRREHDRDQYCRVLRTFMGRDWIKKMANDTREFALTLDYLRDRNVAVLVVVLPNGSWEDELPFAEEYNKQVQAICQSKGVEFFDWSHMLPDEDFGDTAHTNLAGIAKLQPAFLQLARPHLIQTGALNAQQSIHNPRDNEQSAPSRPEGTLHAAR
jgi:hypothetical protein